MGDSTWLDSIATDSLLVASSGFDASWGSVSSACNSLRATRGIKSTTSSSGFGTFLVTGRREAAAISDASRAPTLRRPLRRLLARDEEERLCVARSIGCILFAVGAGSAGAGSRATVGPSDRRTDAVRAGTGRVEPPRMMRVFGATDAVTGLGSRIGDFEPSCVVDVFA